MNHTNNTKLTTEQKRKILSYAISTLGIDIIAVDTAKKNEAKINKDIIWFKENKTQILAQNLTTDDYLTKVDNGCYDDGNGVCCGIIRNGRFKDYSLILLDIDKREGLEAFLNHGDRQESIEELADRHYVEFNGQDRDSHIHIPILLPPGISISSKGSDDIIGIEVITNGMWFGLGSPHHNDLNYIQMGSAGIDKIWILDKPFALYLQEHIASICEKNRVNYFLSGGEVSRKEYLEAYMEELEHTTIKIGSRHEHAKMKGCSYFMKYTGQFANLSDDQRFERWIDWMKRQMEVPLYESDQQEVLDLWHWILKTFSGKRQQERNERATKQKQAQKEARKYSSKMCEKKQKIAESLNEDIREIILEDIWTRVSEDPLRFVIARRREGDICRAIVSSHYVNSGNDKKDEAIKKKVYCLNYGTTVFRVFPVQVTLHESPLKFLESPPTYSIVFENQSNKRFMLTGSIEQIIQHLKEMSGCVVNAYGVNEVLSAIIGAFEDDDNLIVDKSVDFEGYYYADGGIHISKIDFDKKHPVRTKEEVLECINYFEKRIKFQVWEYDGKEVDRRDVFASALRWTVPAPFNFVIKQLSPPAHKRYQKAFDMTGERDGGKTGLSQEMLCMHGNGTGQKDVDSIYSVPAGSANTEAKLGKIVSRTTYPVEISEIGRVESYGKDEKLVETFKNAIESIKVRDGRKDNRYDAPFPGCSPLILNGNSFISKKGELLKRLHVIKFSQEDRHDRSPKSPFNQLQAEEGHLIKILGDWTMRWIWEHRKELLLSGKYDGYQIGDFAIHEFYKSVGKQVPDWLTLWITDTSLEELDVDEKSLIRSIVNDHINKTLAGRGQIPDSLNERIETILDREYWSWIRKGIKRTLIGKHPDGSPNFKEESTGSYYIDTSVVEIFRQRLPDLTFKKLGEVMSIQITKDKNGNWVLKCTQQELIDFIHGGIWLEEVKEDSKIGTINSVQGFW